MRFIILYASTPLQCTKAGNSQSLAATRICRCGKGQLLCKLFYYVLKVHLYTFAWSKPQLFGS